VRLPGSHNLRKMSIIGQNARVQTFGKSLSVANHVLFCTFIMSTNMSDMT